MKQIAMLFPYAPSYRKSIYQLMDQELRVDWFFCGDAIRPLKLLDYQLLSRCNLTMRERQLFGPITYYKGLTSLHLDRYDAIIMAGVPTNISEWQIIFKYAKAKKGPRVYLWTHGWYGKETWLKRKLKHILYNRVYGLLLYGEYAKNIMLKEGFDPSRLYVIKNSLDYDSQLELRRNIVPSDIYKRYFDNNNPTLIFIGRLKSVKKLDQLINAVAVLKQKGEYYNVVFVGDGESRQDLECEVRYYGLQDNVWFIGACYDERKNAELVYNADLCVAPGNIGLTAMHSLMFGCPAISHNEFKWQMPEFESLIPGLTGDFFIYNDVTDLARCISKWFERNGELREDIRQACYNEIDKHWNPHYQLKVIQNLLDAK